MFLCILVACKYVVISSTSPMICIKLNVFAFWKYRFFGTQWSARSFASESFISRLIPSAIRQAADSGCLVVLGCSDAAMRVFRFVFFFGLRFRLTWVDMVILPKIWGAISLYFSSSFKSFQGFFRGCVNVATISYTAVWFVVFFRKLFPPILSPGLIRSGLSSIWGFREKDQFWNRHS